MSSEVLFLIAIAGTLVLSVILIKKDIYPRDRRIFIVLFVTGRVVGHGLDVEFMKILIRRGETGTSYSLASTAIPLALAFAINWIHGRTRNRNA